MSSHPRARSLPAFFACLSILLLLGCVSPPAGAQTGSDAGDDAGAVPPEYPRDDEPLLAWIEAQIASLGDVRRLSGQEAIAAAHRTVDRAIVGAEHHLAQFPESPRRARADLLLARLLFLNIDRYTADKDAANERDFGVKMTPEERLLLQAGYDARIVALIEDGFARDPDLPTRGLLHEVQGELHTRRGRPIEAALEFERARAAYPEHPRLDELLIKLGEAYHYSLDHARALEVALQALEKYPRSNFWPHYFWFAHRALRYTGKCEEARAHWAKHLPGLKARATGTPIAIPGEETPLITPTEYRIDSQRYIDRAGFYEGFFLYALGRPDPAGEAFRAYSDALHARIAGGETLGMDTLVYLNDQADPMERRISLFAGQPAPELGDSFHWLVPPEAEPDTAVVRVRLFCTAQYATERYAGLIALLSRLGNEYWPRGVRIEWVGLTLVEKMVEKETQLLGEIARAHRLGWAIGVDVGPANTAHKAFQVPTGSVVLFVLDADGEIAWHLIDPMHWDEGLIRSVLDRVLARVLPAAETPKTPAGGAPPAKPAGAPAPGGGGR